MCPVSFLEAQTPITGSVLQLDLSGLVIIITVGWANSDFRLSPFFACFRASFVAAFLWNPPFLAYRCGDWVRSILQDQLSARTILQDVHITTLNSKERQWRNRSK